mmetsp:Transcript_41237/g.62756  ORF Transcript_41237/g.62756 Transcript_41237/m.62756 type:complete len:167 (+) Transcript_41237:2198-2698(+)
MDPESNLISGSEELANHPVERYRTWFEDHDTIFNGMVKGLDGEPIYEPFSSVTPSRHLTVVFNLFVFFQIFNMLAARKINDEINIFEGVFTNPMFISVWLVIVIGQVFIVLVGGWAMKVHLNGLTPWQWGFCLALGLTSLIWNFVLKFVPDSICPQLGDEDPDDVI